MKPAIFCVAATVMLGGCATPGSTRPTVPTPVCASSAQCSAEWAEARTFVVDHAAYKIQTYSRDFLQTYNATNESTGLAATVNRRPLPGGRYAIVASFWCDNLIGCIPDPTRTLDAFNREVARAGTIDTAR